MEYVYFRIPFHRTEPYYWCSSWTQRMRFRRYYHGILGCWTVVWNGAPQMHGPSITYVPLLRILYWGPQIWLCMGEKLIHFSGNAGFCAKNPVKTSRSSHTSSVWNNDIPLDNTAPRWSINQHLNPITVRNCVIYQCYRWWKVVWKKVGPKGGSLEIVACRVLWSILLHAWQWWWWGISGVEWSNHKELYDPQYRCLSLMHCPRYWNGSECCEYVVTVSIGCAVKGWIVRARWWEEDIPITWTHRMQDL
jgi:hypothetical protein